MTENSYRVKFNSKAIDDLEEIYSYISGELFAGDAADDLLNRIESSIMRLKKLPYSCNYVADEFLKIKGYRKLVIDNCPGRNRKASTGFPIPPKRGLSPPGLCRIM